MADTKLDVSGYDLTETLQKARRAQREATQGAELGELQALLLPLAVAIARLSARLVVQGVTQ